MTHRIQFITGTLLFNYRNNVSSRIRKSDFLNKSAIFKLDFGSSNSGKYKTIRI
jgi:hypothetical protein